MPAAKLELVQRLLIELQGTGRVSDDFFAFDFVWDVSGFDGWVEESEYHGRAGFDAQMARWTAPFQTWTMDIERLIDAGDGDVLVIGTQRGVLKDTTAAVEMPLAQILTVRDDKVCRLRSFAKAEHAYAAAGVGPHGQASA
jgi:ketosteroid isomerase-like protein